MEEVFLTHLELEFPELNQVTALAKGDLTAYEFMLCFVFLISKFVLDLTTGFP